MTRKQMVPGENYPGIPLGGGAYLVCMADVPVEPVKRYASLSAMHDESVKAFDDETAVARRIESIYRSAGIDLDDDNASPSCELCGHSYAQKHRLIPGNWGGTYHPSNVVYLCPNHHAMIHLRMKYYRNPDRMSNNEWNRLDDAMLDPGINQLWADRVKRIMIQRSIDLGTYIL